MKKILVIGLNTFREAIRNKVLYSLLFFALTVIVASMAFGALAVTSKTRLTLDLGLGGMSLFSVVIAIFVGVNLVYKELERKTVYTLLSKPVRRYQFLLGKFVGLGITLGVQILVMAAVLSAVLLYQGAELGSTLAIMVVLIYLEVLVVTAIAVLFSSFSTPFLSGAFTIGVFLLGRSVPDIKLVADTMGDSALSLPLEIIAKLIPNLRYFYVTGANVDGQAISVSGTFVDWSYVGLATGYAGLYLVIVLILAIGLFSRRDFV